MENYLKNWHCDNYTIYGDNKNRNFSYNDLKEYFNINGREYAEVKKDFEGNYFSFKQGELVTINQTFKGYQIRLSHLSLDQRGQKAREEERRERENWIKDNPEA